MFFSVKRPDSLSWHPDGSSSVGRTIRLLVRTHATCPHISEAARVRTALMIRPNGDPTGSIYTLVAALSPYPTKKSSFGL
jgi:hypothetical protein